MLKREDIRIRDPFVLTDIKNRCYYMYGTTDLLDNDLCVGNTFSVYRTADLINFEEPKIVVNGNKYGFGAIRIFGWQKYTSGKESIICSVVVRRRTELARRIFMSLIRLWENLCPFPRIR